MSSISRQISREIQKNENLVLNKSNYLKLRTFARVPDLKTLLYKSNSGEIDLLNLLPKTYNSTRKNRYNIRNTDIEKEITWQFLLIQKHYKIVKLYLEKKEKFEQNLFLGNYDGAKNILKDIEENICISDWSIEMQILTNYYSDDSVEGFKNYVNKLLTQFKSENTYEYFFTYYNSLRIEKRLSIHNFDKKFRENIDSLKGKNSNDIDYFYYKINFYEYIGLYQEEKLLQKEDSSSIIDRYETLLFSIQSLFCKEKHTAIQLWLSNLIKDLYGLIKDERLSNMLFYIGYPEKIVVTNKDIGYCKLIDLYTTQQYQEAKKQARGLLVKYPNCFDIYKIYVLSCIYTDTFIDKIFEENSIAGKSLLDIYTILLKKNEFKSSITNLKNLYSSLGKMSWAIKCNAFINNETSTYTENFRYRLFSSLCDNILYPRIIRQITQKDILDKITKSSLYNINNNIKFLVYIQTKCLDINDIDSGYTPSNSFREKIIHAQVLKSLGKYELSYKIYNEISINKDFQDALKIAHNEIKLTHGEMRCLVELGKYNEALTLVTKQILKNRIYSRKLKYSTLIHNIMGSQDITIQSNIHTPIYLNLYKEKLIDQWGALDNFLSLKNIKHPHELESILNTENEDAIIYIYENLCNKDIIDNSIQYDNMQGVIDELIKVQKILIKKYPNNEQYKEHKTELEKVKSKLKAKNHLNNGKLYVNIAGLKKDLKYFELQKDFETLLRIVDYKGKNDNENKTKLIIYSEYFIQLFYQIRNIFVLDNDYGFDLYLGTRIRHGWIQSILRSVFEEYNLVTIIDSDTSKYIDNDKWGNLSSNTVFQNIMSVFSNNVDNHIKELYERILKVKITDRESDALFDFYYTDEELTILRDSVMRKIADNFSFENFFDAIVDNLLERTDSNSGKAKDYLLKTTLDKIIVELDNLLPNKLFSQFDAFKTAAINCKTEIQNKIQEVNAWFSLSTDSPPFKIDIPINTCHETCCKGVELCLNIAESIKEKNVKGKYFHPMADIFHNLFDNTIQHSKLNINDLKINISIEEYDNNTIVKFRNNFSPTINSTILKKEVLECLSKSPDPTQIKKSGLARIKIVLEKDMQLLDSSIELDDITNNMITFKIKLEKFIYCYENIDN